MARPYRIQFKGACYHVIVRGNPEIRLFKNETDRTRFLSMLGEAVGKHEVLLHAFFLNKDRIELVVETPTSNLSSFLQGCQTAYAQYYRKKYKFSGPIVHDRFRSKVVQKDVYLLPLTRHVHLLGVSERMAKKKTLAKLRKELADCCTSYSSYTVPSKGFDFVTTSDTLKLLKKSAPSYKQYVEDAFKQRDPEFVTLLEASPIAIGAGEYVQEMKQMHDRFVAGRKPTQLTVYGRKKKGVARTKVLDLICKDLKVDKSVFVTQSKTTDYRAIASLLLYRYAALTQGQIAEVLGLKSGAAVSLQIRKLRKKMAEDAALKKSVERLRRKLDKM
jgi:hypothetical protein